MKRRPIILALALVSAVAVVFIAWPRGPKEPVYEGKPLSYWLPDLGVDSSPSERERSRKAICALGTNSLPWLMAEFTRPRRKWVVAFHRWQDKLTRSPSRRFEHETHVWRFAGALHLLGPALEPALPELSRYLDHQDLSWSAAVAMSGAGELALPYFTQQMNSTNLNRQQAALGGLCKLAQHSEAAVPPLARALQSTNSWTRVYAADMLGRVSLRPDIMVPALTAALSDPHPDVQTFAADALGNLGPAAMSAIPALRQFWTNATVFPRQHASNALYKIDPTTGPP